MNKSLAILLVFTVILFLFACGKNSTISDFSEKQPALTDETSENLENSLCSVPTKAPDSKKAKFQAIRTGCYYNTNSEYPDFPYTVIIETSAELKKYIKENENNFDLSRKDEVYADTTIGFLDAVDKYDDEYFKENSLIIAVDTQPSGSIRYTHTELVCSEKNELFDTLRIIEYHPCLQTCDEAAWHIIVEVKKGAYADEIELKIFEDHEEVPEYLR